MRRIGDKLDEGDYDANDLARWFWELEDAIAGNQRATRAEPLDNVRHEVMEAMSKQLPSIPVDMALIEPEKARDELDPERFACARMDETDPVVVEENRGGKLKLLDGHHRFYAAKDAGRETLPAVRLDSSGAVKAK